MDYEHSHAIICTSLDGVDSDSNKLAIMLANEPYLFTVTHLSGRQSTKSNLISTLDSLSKFSTQSRIFVYISGNTSVDEQKRSHLKCYPFGANDTIEYARILESVTQINAKHVAVILDADIIVYEFDPLIQQICYPPAMEGSSEKIARQAIIPIRGNRINALPILIDELEKKKDSISFFFLWYEKLVSKITYLCNLHSDDGGDFVF